MVSSSSLWSKEFAELRAIFRTSFPLIFLMFIYSTRGNHFPFGKEAISKEIYVIKQAFNVRKHFRPLSEIGPDRLWLLNVQPGHQPVKFLPGQISGLTVVSWPAVPAPDVVQAFIYQDKTRTIVHERLDSVTSFSAKEK